MHISSKFKSNKTVKNGQSNVSCEKWRGKFQQNLWDIMIFLNSSENAWKMRTGTKQKMEEKSISHFKIFWCSFIYKSLCFSFCLSHWYKAIVEWFTKYRRILLGNYGKVLIMSWYYLSIFYYDITTTKFGPSQQFFSFIT